jgi:hypothetical protein
MLAPARSPPRCFSPATLPPKTDDVDIASFVPTLEYLEADFYAIALDAGVL